MVYEGISMICFNCGWYGHINCPPSSDNDISKKSEGHPPEPNTQKDAKEDAMDISSIPSHKDETVGSSTLTHNGGHGPIYMLMYYKK